VDRQRLKNTRPVSDDQHLFHPVRQQSTPLPQPIQSTAAQFIGQLIFESNQKTITCHSERSEESRFLSRRDS
jgi:hypothetical protein